MIRFGINPGDYPDNYDDIPEVFRERVCEYLNDIDESWLNAYRLKDSERLAEHHRENMRKIAAERYEELTYLKRFLSYMGIKVERNWFDLDGYFLATSQDANTYIDQIAEIVGDYGD